MKVLLCIRADYYKNFAGDSMQLIKTAKYLRDMGIDVHINNGGITDFSSYDIIHLFNLTRMGETYKYYKLARYYKKDIVISPIYWDLRQYYEYIKDDESLKLWDKCNVYRKEILKGCKMFYPNSEIEAKLIRGQYGEKLNYQVVYNGVEVEDYDIPIFNFKERYNLDSYVLCVGRISKRKNQLQLCRICKELNIQLVLIGGINDKDYYNECMKYSNVLHLGFMDNNQIYNAYHFAKLHVLASFVETPGLSSLEAAVCGCNIVSTNIGCAEEYFKDKALYCNPYDEEDIYNSIKIGMKKNKTDVLKSYIYENFQWEKCINTLNESYKTII